MQAGYWAESAGIPVNRLSLSELQEMDVFIQKRSQAVEFSEEERLRYNALYHKAHGDEVGNKPLAGTEPTP
jgi:hypothetical protein